MSAKTLCLQHAEKLTLASASFVLVAYVVLGMGVSREDRAITDIRAGLDAARAVMSDTSRPSVASYDQCAELRSRWASMPEWQLVATDWAPYWRTRTVPNLIDRGPAPKNPQLLPPVLDPPSVDVGKVVIVWKKDAGTSIDIDRWILRRRGAREAAWKVIAEPKGDITTFTDTTVEPETRYDYQVSAVPVEGPARFDDHGRDSEVLGAQSASIVRLHLYGGAEDLAQIRVEKYLGGAWRSWTFPVRPGEAIGGKVCPFPNRAILDFGTGLTLVSFDVRTRRITIRNASGEEHELR